MREEGKGKTCLWLLLAAVAVGVAIAVFLQTRQDAALTVDAASRHIGRGLGLARQDAAASTAGRDVPAAPQAQEDETAPDEDSADSDESQTEEEKREAAEEKLVNDFDDLTDKWQEPSAKGVTMADVDTFVKQFRQVPKERQDECVHRALNLIPDENVMLLAGILMDKSMDKEIVETVYNDILNRDEDVKEPILQQIFKDKTHPCWADTAWILDVTGELPKAK